MRIPGLLSVLSTAVCLIQPGLAQDRVHTVQQPLLQHADTGRNVSFELFAELEELARIVDISYCVGLATAGITKPFKCLSRCDDFPGFELVTTWNTGPLLSDSCGYIANDHPKKRILVAFRGTYSITNTIVDLSTIPQQYEPYPGASSNDSSSTSLAHAVLTPPSEPMCTNCTVHMGFHSSWINTRKRIIEDLAHEISLHPDYQLHLVGHSLGGAVAALAGLESLARGWDPIVTTFGEPRIGNAGLVAYIDQRFDLVHPHARQSDEVEDGETHESDRRLRYRRVTHVDDPVPLLPLSEWGYAMHAGEIFIAKPALSPELSDLHRCDRDNDPACIAGQDPSVPDQALEEDRDNVSSRVVKRDLLGEVRDEIHDVVHEPWGIPARYKLWQLFFAHRDYFWRLGLCVPGGDPLGGGGKYDPPEKGDL